MKISHCQYAHCESGVLSSLLTQNGLPMSEPMVFGITSSLSFFFLPIVKINNMPLISYREVPKNIVKKLPKILNFEMVTKTYNDRKKANDELTKYVQNGQSVGLQTSVFYLPYFPKDMRFHFNAHNLIVHAKKGDVYTISDPVFEEFSSCKEEYLTQARFAKGVFAPKGFLYFPVKIPKDINLSPIIQKAIHKNAKRMLTPFPYGGVKGMRKLARKIETLSKKDKRYTINYLTHIVRMQEEIGTGGGGFRYLYSAFLDEACNYELDTKKLKNASNLLTKSGDLLREFALLCVKNCKNIENLDTQSISKKLHEAAEVEHKAFSELKAL